MAGLIEAIPTRYRGYHFRSRLEARWAVCLDSLGVPWEYEREGYVLPDGTQYLPDFWLPQEGIYLEIKGTEVKHAEQKKAAHLARGQQTDVVIAAGVPGECLIHVYSPYQEIPSEQWKAMTALELPSGVWFDYESYVRRPDSETAYHWQIAEWIQTGVAFDFNEDLGRLALWHAVPEVDTELAMDPFGRLREVFRTADWYQPRYTVWAPHHEIDTDNMPSLDSEIYGPGDIPITDAMRKAIDAARSARFEFGESGAS
ncbi:MAG: hypothetical protein KF875_03865 [Trueperaceae bacterium]|nr:hypothetical protein [Trueperaceae bacterium]